MMIVEMTLSYFCLLPILRRKFVVFWIHSFTFKEYLNEKKSHNMLCLILGPRLKTFPLVFSFIGHEEGVNIVEIYDR
jgi:hypothetical protein